jgi:hypothetical protein
MGDNNPPEDNNHPPPPEQPAIQHMGDNHSQEDNILGLEPKWALSQKGTKLLEDGDNYRYNVYRPITAGKIVSYRCQLHRSKKCPSVAYLCTETSKIIRINNSHNHLPSILRQKALAVEREYIRAAATVGKTSTIDVVARIRTTLQRSEDAAATSSMRKTKALTAAIRRQRIKVQGGGEPVAATLKEIHDNFPEKYASTDFPAIQRLPGPGDQTAAHACVYQRPREVGPCQVQGALRRWDIRDLLRAVCPGKQIVL